MKIRELRVRPVRVPMREAHRTASGTVEESPLVLADIMTDDGVEGHGIVFTYTVAALEPVAALMRNLAPLVVGEPLAPREIERKLAARFRLLGTQGLVGMALAGIDMAVWDALARSHQMPLAALLGGAPKSIQAYGAVGYDGEAGSAHAAEKWARCGVRGIKAKLGYPTVGEDLAVIRAMRRAMRGVGGDRMAIMVDYNQSLVPAEAIERLRVLDGEGLAWVEEPVASHDFEGHAMVAREARTPIQCGENWWGAADMRQAITAGAADYMMADAMKIGGVSGWMRAAALAETHAIRLSSHLWPELSAQVLSVTATAHWLEYADWWNPILASPLRLEDGMAVCSDAAGSGIEWDEEAVRRFAA